MTPTPPEPCDHGEPTFGPVPPLTWLDLSGQNIPDIDTAAITIIEVEGEWL